jgi:hypothetical protein
VAAPAPGRARATPAGAASPAGPRDAVAALPHATFRAAE